jgi:hypothetical protein
MQSSTWRLENCPLRANSGHSAAARRMYQMMQAIDIIRAVEIVRNRCNIVPTELRERLAAPASSVCVT